MAYRLPLALDFASDNSWRHIHTHTHTNHDFQLLRLTNGHLGNDEIYCVTTTMPNIRFLGAGRWQHNTQQGYDVRNDNANDHCISMFQFFSRRKKMKTKLSEKIFAKRDVNENVPATQLVSQMEERIRPDSAWNASHSFVCVKQGIHRNISDRKRSIEFSCRGVNLFGGIQTQIDR